MASLGGGKGDSVFLSFPWSFPVRLEVVNALLRVCAVAFHVVKRLYNLFGVGRTNDV